MELRICGFSCRHIRISTRLEMQKAVAPPRVANDPVTFACSVLFFFFSFLFPHGILFVLKVGLPCFFFLIVRVAVLTFLSVFFESCMIKNPPTLFF